jgi:RNA polymerase sigma-70 factor (ECF subfamily)
MRGSGWRMVTTSANGQPALAAYCPDGRGALTLHTLQVLTVTGDGISRNVVFQDPNVFRAFALDLTLTPDAAANLRQRSRTRNPDPRPPSKVHR